MKSLTLSLALAASVGLCSLALADCAGNANGAPAECCGHGLLSKLKLHHCGGCEAKAEAPKTCDPCGHKLTGMLSGIKLHRGCCEAPKCEPKPCAPKCEPKPCTPKCPKPCKVHVCKPKCEVKCEAKCEAKCPTPCKEHHVCNRCQAPKPACDPCKGHSLNLGRLFGKACKPCEAAATEAPAAAPAPAPAPKPTSTGASSNGLLILTPAG